MRGKEGFGKEARSEIGKEAKRDLFVLAIVCPVFLRGFVFLNMLLINLLFLWERDERTNKNCLSSNGEHMKGFMYSNPIFRTSTNG